MSGKNTEKNNHTGQGGSGSFYGMERGDKEVGGSGADVLPTAYIDAYIRKGVNNQEPLPTAIHNLSNKVDNEISSLQKQKNRLIEVLGVFAALFTFISIEVQLLKSLISAWTLLGVTLIITGVLFAFIIALIITLKAKDDNYNFKQYTPLMLIFFILTMAGTLLVYLGGDITTEMVVQEKIDGRYYSRTEVDDKIETLYNKMSIGLENVSNPELKNYELEKFKRCVLAKDLDFCVSN